MTHGFLAGSAGIPPAFTERSAELKAFTGEPFFCDDLFKDGNSNAVGFG
jgi:hypothetical protein